MVILFGLKIILIICLSTFAVLLQHALPCQLALAVIPVKSSGYRISTAVDLSGQFLQVSNRCQERPEHSSSVPVGTTDPHLLPIVVAPW